VSALNKGYLCLVLHAHLPYVRHGDRDDYLEERWVYEAMLESYAPLLMTFERLLRDGIDFRLTLSVSPTLLSMLADSLVRDRFRAHLGKCLKLALQETKRTADKPEERRLALMYLERFREIAAYCGKYEHNLIVPLRRLQQAGRLELITCAATHAFLPFVETEEAIRAQIGVAVETHLRILGQKPAGIWLPECGYTPGLDRLLAEAGLRYFFVEQHGIEHATPMPRHGLYAPLVTPFGVAAFARDPESSKQVWSSEVGYPGDFDYREYYRDIGYDLDFGDIAAFIHPSGIRVNTGLKYHRITGKSGHKELYNPERAREKAALHAGDFLCNRERQIEHLASRMERKPVVVAPYDAELFGHWWYEGPQFLDFLLRKIACDTQRFRLITPSEYLALDPDNDRARLPMSSWGRNGYGEVWLNETNAWIYRHLHQAEREMIALVQSFPRPTPLEQRTLRQAARELMLAQSSDWAFMMDNQTMPEYAVRRTHDHLVRFARLSGQLRQGAIEEAALVEMEQAYPLFPWLDPSFYLPKQAHKVNMALDLVAVGETEQPQLKVLVLCWEFPPHVVGGLAKAVYDLSRHLAKQNAEVHVVTGYAHGSAEREVMEGVHVYRVRTYLPEGDSDFLDWVFQFNLALVDRLEQLFRQGLAVDLVHAHDWLVGFAAMELKRRYQLPLLTTIHATEQGRNQGIHTEMQRRIHQAEWELTHESQKVIVCSGYMAEQCRQLFSLPPEKIAVIRNGIEIAALPAPDKRESLQEVRQRFALPEEKIIFFVGRMVREKGIHLLLEAAPQILRQHPDVKFILAGRGPLLAEGKRLAWETGLGEKMLFPGFVDDDTRNRLFRLAEIAVFPSLYEPFGIVALEAMAHGTPLLAADTGGLAEIVRHGENGVKMYAGDTGSLAAQISWLLTHPKERREMAERAWRELSVQYDWNRLAGQTIAAYRSILPAGAKSGMQHARG
jgi:1,4-alpha-glucan branching enzyme